MANMLRNIPSVNELLESPPLKRLLGRANRNTVVAGVRDFLDNLRNDVSSAASQLQVPHAEELAERIADWILRTEQPRLRPVINATGILLHTGLGRAPLAEPVLQEMVQIGCGYCSLEVDLESGERSQRATAVERLLRRLTGAEAALVVNNNAAATLITLAAGCAGREVIVSRGELIEIGGSYRLPDVMSTSGAVLREVGTTNKTHLYDYHQAIGEQTAALMRVHTSNYRVVGFTERPSLPELVALARERQLVMIDDIGSGALIGFAKYGVRDEPMVAESIRAGADLVLFSGDKLLGGPQCGVIVGRRPLVQKICRHPLMRALRVDKITLAALQATLRLYDDKEQVERSLPLLSLLSTPLENLENRARRLAPQLESAEAIEAASVMEDSAYVGGGSLPTQAIPTFCIALKPARSTVNDLAARFRAATPSVFGRVQQDRLLLDLRSVFPREDRQLVQVAEQLHKPSSAPASSATWEKTNEAE